MILWLVILLYVLPACPTDGTITSSYGVRRSPINGYQTMHRGLDLGAPEGTPIRAMWAGQVVYAGRSKGYGNFIVIQHRGGWKTRYAHASTLFVSRGQIVQRGEIIGQVGATGRATGNHLHVEVKKGYRTLNPEKILWQCGYTNASLK